MMKKSIFAISIAVLAAASGLSHAADNTVTQLQSGVYVENTAAGCSILRDRVTVNTSNGVTAVYNCLTAQNKVNVGGCHASGSQRPTTVACAAVGADDDGPIYNGADCTAAGVAATPPQQTEIAGRRGYTGSTTGGSVGQASLNSETCDITAIGALPGVTQ